MSTQFPDKSFHRKSMMTSFYTTTNNPQPMKHKNFHGAMKKENIHFKGAEKYDSSLLTSKGFQGKNQISSFNINPLDISIASSFEGSVDIDITGFKLADMRSVPQMIKTIYNNQNPFIEKTGNEVSIVCIVRPDLTGKDVKDTIRLKEEESFGKRKGDFKDQFEEDPPHHPHKRSNKKTHIKHIIYFPANIFSWNFPLNLL